MKLAEKDPSKSASSKADKTKKATAGQETTKPKAVKKELIKKFPSWHHPRRKYCR